MRIGFLDYVCDPAKPGSTGLSDIVWDIAKRLARRGDSVDIVAPYTVEPEPVAGITVHRFKVPLVGYRNIIGHLLIILSAYRLLRRLGSFDVIHVPEYLSAAVVGRLARTTPVVFTEPGNIFERIANGNPYDHMTTAVYKLAARSAAATCARAIVTSAEMAEWWHFSGIDEQRLCRLPLGVDRSVFRRLPNARQLLGIAPDERLVVCAARLSRENGLDVALRAVARVASQVSGLRLVILGDGPERDDLVRLSRFLGLADLVRWPGWVDLAQLPLFYSAADAFVFSGSSGGTPRVLLQAMCCGAPIVASAIGGIVDHITPDTDGLLFPAHADAALAEALCRLFADPALARRLGDAAAYRASRTVDWDILVPRIKGEVYEPAVRMRRLAPV